MPKEACVLVPAQLKATALWAAVRRPKLESTLRGRLGLSDAATVDMPAAAKAKRQKRQRMFIIKDLIFANAVHHSSRT